MRILIAEDEKDMNNIIAKKLRLEGYSTDSCYDGLEALDLIKFTDYDAIILDVMMPKCDGFAVITEMRKNEISTPVIFLTARDTIADKVQGLDLGANDYLVKPFSFEELLARIRAMTRKTTGNLTNIYTIADLTVDCTTRTVMRNNIAITLSAKEYAILEYLILNQDIVLSREKIENHIWNYDYEGGTNVVDVYIRYLRKKIDENFDNKLIHTVRGMGYILSENR